MSETHDSHGGGQSGHKGDKEKKDPWYKGEIEGTIKQRESQRRDLFNVIKAMDAQLILEVTKILKGKTTHPGQLPDWSLLDEESESYNKEVAKMVMEKVEEVYSLDSELHPLADVIKKANLEKNYFNKGLINGIYFSHVESLKRNIGKSSNYMGVMEELHGKNLEKVVKETQVHMVGDIEPEKHGDYILDFLKEKYHFEENKVHTDLMKQNVHELMLTYIGGKLSKEAIHRTYKKHGEVKQMKGHGREYKHAA